VIDPAHAQSGATVLDSSKRRQLEDLFKKFDATSIKLSSELDRIKQEDRGTTATQKPLIKSW
jgi:hypothetical protein